MYLKKKKTTILATKKTKPCYADPKVIEIILRVRDKALDDVERSVLKKDYKNYPKYYKTLRDMHDEMFRLLDRLENAPKKLQGEIRFEFQEVE